MPASASAVGQLQQKIWAGAIPVEIRLASADCRTFDQADPYLICVPRLSYLPFLLPRLHAFFSSSLIDPGVVAHEAWFSFEDVPLKWHYPIGLLYDLFSGGQPTSSVDPELEASRHVIPEGHGEQEDERLPWKLVLHYTEFPFEQLIQLDAQGKVLLDTFTNSVKEADFIRNGTAKVAMSLSKNDSDALWKSVQTHDLNLFNSINNKLLNPPGSALRHIPIKIYLPTTSAPASESASELPQAGSIRVVQSLVTPLTPARQPVTLGTALNTVLPRVFPSRRNPVLASPVMHGAVLPMNATMEELGRAAAYADGFLHVVVVMLG